MFFDRLPGSGYVCAHRGARALAPENTMMAAELGLALGADYWETDVHKIADGSLVIFHDDVLSRTTDVRDHDEFAARAPWITSGFSFEELRRLDAGAWFAEQDPFGTIASGEVSPVDVDRMRGQRIPSLRAVLEFTRRHDFPLNIEIKDQTQSPGDLSIVGDVLEMVRSTGVEDLVLVSSFNHDYLAEMRRLAPEIPIAVLVEGAHPANLVQYLHDLGAETYHPDHALVDADLVRGLTAAGIRVAPWTVNDMDRAMALIEAGCFGIITDFVHSLRKRLVQRQE
ncbi:MAG: Glycerophosphodiester phosphodiesterase [Desulfomicrobiaceae bacterium]|jgi:glycerophosphoryl diester phosphodiesterase|nr:Glycerophosphodiester phosphodiesterase [Desulfomicrobiaceae bacterium]